MQVQQRLKLDEDGIPIVDAYRLPADRRGECDDFVFLCLFCRDWHSHTPEEGHVSHHCTAESSPFRRTGYILRCVGTISEEEMDRRLKELKRPPRTTRRMYGPRSVAKEEEGKP